MVRCTMYARYIVSRNPVYRMRLKFKTSLVELPDIFVTIERRFSVPAHSIDAPVLQRVHFATI